MSGEIRRAERALHRRMTLACEAATESGLPGVFRTWGVEGFGAVLATDPALSFLTTISGFTAGNVMAAIDLLSDGRWRGVTPRLLVPQEPGPAVELALLAAGLVQVGDRVTAVRRLDDLRPADTGSTWDVVDTAGVDGEPGAVDAFVDLLLAGYQVGGVVAAFIAAEHRHPTVQRFLAADQDLPVAAAAMTVHDDVAVLGGAATLSAFRGRGAQSRLLQLRLRVAAGAGCSLAVATATGGSASARNLRAAGFRIHHQVLWSAAAAIDHEV